MLYHALRRHPHKSSSNDNSESTTDLMPRFQYSRTPLNSTISMSEPFFPRHYTNSQASKPVMIATTTSNNNNNNNNANSNNQYSNGSSKSAFIPLVTNSRTMTPDKREFVEIPIKREDGTSTTNTSIRHLPIHFISETTSLPFNNNNTNSGDTSPKPYYANLFRPSSRYSQHHSNNYNEESAGNMSRLPSVGRRLSLTIPVTSTATTAAVTDDETVKQNLPSPAVRPIPIRFTQPSNVASIPTNSSRISSAILRSSTLSDNPLQRQRTDFMDTSSSDFTSTPSNTSPVRRTDVMAREAIQGIVRFQQQQQRNGSISDNTSDSMVRSPVLSRRVIVNLKNNQSVSLDSRISSANPISMKPSPVPSSARITQRNNLYHIPVLHEIQMPPHPATIAAETFLQLSRSPSANYNNNNNSYKNEFRMEIPVTVIPNNDETNRIYQNDVKDDGLIDYDQQITFVTERIPSANINSNQVLKSILKRSSSRETVSRKNVSFMNA